MQKLIAPLLAIVLLGAGCSKAVTSEEAKTETKPAVTSTTEKKPEIAKAENTGEVRELVAAKTDDTWKTYTSKSLGFSFMTPTKGRYAPQWEVKIFPSGDSQIKDGCFVYAGALSDSDTMYDIQNTVKVGDTSFCHTNGSDNGAGQHYVLDSFATQMGKSWIVIQFTKHTVNAGAVCSEAKFSYSTSGTACIQFIDEEYQSMLDSIVGTFKLNQ